MNHPFHLAVLPVLTLPALGLTVRGYNAADHDRFTGFPAAPVMNPTFIHDATKFTGVGWWVNTFTSLGTVYSHVTAVTPRHFLTASHAAPPIGTTIRFVDSTGAVIERTTAANLPVPNDSAANSDLCVVRLSSPLPATVAVYPWLNLSGGDPAYTGQPLVVLGQNPNGTPRGGSATLTGFDPEDGFAEGTHHLTWTYNPTVGPANECALSGGDSGGPAFVTVGGVPAIVGVHSAAGTIGPLSWSFSSFVPHYATRVDDLLAAAGHRMVPVNFTPTTLAIPAAAASPVTLRRANPGTIGFAVANTGGDSTGNLAVTLTFPAGQEPDSLTAAGWVVESGGTGVWHLRAGTLAAAANLSFTANWAALPGVASIGCTITADADTADAVNAAPSFLLGPSYAEWADGLAQAGQTDDPDADGLANLLEYAFGGDAESGAMLLPGDHPLRPVLAESAGTVTLSYPERSDAEVRGLSYVVETSAALDGLAGATTLPAGAVSSAAAFEPDVPGLVKRTVTWPTDGPQRFVRVKVELAE